MIPQTKREPRGANKLAPSESAMKLLALSYAVIASFLLGQFSSHLLPDRFFNDEQTILDFIAGREQSFGASPFATTAWLFTVLGLGESSQLVALVAVATTTVVVAIAFWRVPKYMHTWSAVIIGCIAIGLAGVYVSRYSKEFFVVPLIALFLLVAGRARLELFWIVAGILYAVYVREYWLLIIALYLAFRLLISRTTSLPRLIFSWLLVISGIVVSMNLLLGIRANHYRVATNNTLSTDRATEIFDPIASAALPLQVINITIVLATLLVPIPLLLAGSAIHIASATVVASLWIGLGRGLSGHFPQRAGGRSQDVRLIESCVALLLAYVTTQALFEPDYGSYLRHLTPVLPVFIVAISLMRFRHRGAPA